jgi:hypothetical protein
MHSMRSLPILSRWHRRSTLGDGANSRIGVHPPSLRQAPDSAWQRVIFWLMAPGAHDAAPPMNRVPLVRVEFMRSIADIDGDDADVLRNRIALSRSLRELWHLRSDLFRVVGVALSQSQAETRLAALNRHFPSSTPRSQFGSH